MTTANPVRARKTAVRSVKSEAKGTLAFEYAGDEYTVEADSVKDIEFLEAYEDGNIITALRGALGPVQWATFKGHKDKVQDTDFVELANAMFTALGASQEK